MKYRPHDVIPNRQITIFNNKSYNKNDFLHTLSAKTFSIIEQEVLIL